MIDLLLVTGIISVGALKDHEYLNPYIYSISVAHIWEFFKDKIDVKIYIPDITKDLSVPESKFYVISINYSEILETIKLVKIIRNNFPNSKIIISGQYATTFNEDVLKYINCDYVIRGNEIKALDSLIFSQNLTDNVTTGDKKGIVVENKNISTSLVLNRDAYFGLNWNKMLNNPYYNENTKWVVTASGCYYDCKFCTNKCFSGQKIKYRDISYITDDINKILNYDNNSHILFTEPLFSANSITHRNYIKKLLDDIYNKTAINKKNKLAVFCRIGDIDEKFLSLLKKYSDKLDFILIIGIDNFNNTILNDMDKNLTKKQIFDKMKLIREYESTIYQICSNIILGTPKDSEDKFYENLEDSYSLFNLYKNTDIQLRLTSSTLLLLPGTKYFNERFNYPSIFETSDDIQKQLQYVLLDEKYLDIKIGLKLDWYEKFERLRQYYIKEIKRLKGRL